MTWHVSSWWKGYEDIAIEDTMSWREIALSILTLMISDQSIDLLRSNFSYLNYGQNPIFCMYEYDWNTMLMTLAREGLIEFYDEGHVRPTKTGKQFLNENSKLIDPDYFINKRSRVRKHVQKSILLLKMNNNE